MDYEQPVWSYFSRIQVFWLQSWWSSCRTTERELNMSHDTRYLHHEFILVAWKINELRTAQISGHVVLSAFGGLGPLTATEHRFFQRKSSVWLGRLIIRRTLGDQLGRRRGWLVTPSEEKIALFRGSWNTGAIDLLTAEEAFWITVFSAWGLGRGLFLVSVSFRDFLKPPHASCPASLKPGPDKSSPPCQKFWDLTPANLPLSSRCYSLIHSTCDSLNLPAFFRPWDTVLLVSSTRNYFLCQDHSFEV